VEKEKSVWLDGLEFPKFSSRTGVLLGLRSFRCFTFTRPQKGICDSYLLRVIKEQVTEEKTRMKKFIQNGVIRYARVPLSLEEEIEAKDLEIKNLKALVDELRKSLEQYEQKPLSKPEEKLPIQEVVPVDSFDCYK
jgi:hypothetical protein